jgi:hypothetical protein
MERNQYDRRDCMEMGERAEIAFVQMALARGWKVNRSSEDQDINEHWDFLIEKDGKSYRIDVKSMKREQETDNVQDIWTWIEFKSVKENEPGWLFGSADIVAFERTSSFVLVKRSDLVDLANRSVDMNSCVKSAKEAKYKLYQRAGRHDLISMIELEKLNDILWEEWKK